MKSNDTQTTTLTKEEWVARCAAHYVKVTDMDKETAQAFAESCFDTSPELSPEDAAEEDINCWEPE